MRQRGFTMPELILAMVVTAIMALALAPLLTQGVNTYVLVSSRSRLVHDIRHALNRMSGEVLHIGPGNIMLIQPQRLSFVDAQGGPADYGLVANGARGAIYRTAIPLLRNVNNLQFIYYDRYGNVTNIPANVRRIVMQITANAPLAGTMTLQSEVFPRRFVYNNFL